MRSALLLLPLLAGVSACDVETSTDAADTNATGTNININATSGKGEDVRITADGDTGKVSVNLPGFDANVTLPKVMLKDSNFDIDGVKLYPGAHVTSVNIQGDKSGTGDGNHVQIIYSAPADPKPVRDWFAKAFADKSISTTVAGESLSGKTRDGTPFAMTFAPGKAGTTTGTIVIDDRKSPKGTN